MNPIDVGYGPVQFERSFKAVPKPPTPSLAGLGSGLGYNPPKMLVNTAAIGLVGLGLAAVVKGDKSKRVRNAKMTAAFVAVAIYTISS